MTSMMTRAMQLILLKARHLRSHRNRSKLLPDFDNFSFLQSRKTIRHIRSSKVFFIMRGLPGSGKSTLVRAIKLRFKEAVVCSADSFFVREDGTYAYDFEKLPEAHEECANLAQKSAEMGVRHIVIDNTNILRWEMGKYLKLAFDYGYAVIIVEPRTPWNFDPMELAARNTHGCTAEMVEQKMKKFKAILPVYWGWMFNQTVASELLMLGETYFDLCMRTIPEFASYMNKLGASKGFTLPLSFKEFYCCPNSSLLHCTSFYSGVKNRRSPGTDEYASRPDVLQSMGKAFSMKLVGVMFSPRTVGIRVVLNKGQLSLWGAEDIWFPQPPPKPKVVDVAQLKDSSESLTQDAPKVQKQKKDRQRHSDKLTVLKREENDNKNVEASLTDVLDSSVSDDFMLLMTPDLSDTNLALDSTGIKSAQDQSGYKVSPYPGSTETASYQKDIKINADYCDTTLVLESGCSEMSNVQSCSETELGENRVKNVPIKRGASTMVTRAAYSVKTIPRMCYVFGNDQTDDSVEEMLEPNLGGSFPCCSCTDGDSRSLSSRKHSDISAHNFCQTLSLGLGLKNLDSSFDKFSQIPSTCQDQDDLYDISAENICQKLSIHEEMTLNILADKRCLLHHQELIPQKIDDVNVAEFFVKDAKSEDSQNSSQPDIFSPHPVENNTSFLLENSIKLSDSDVCPEPAQSMDTTSVEGSSDEVPRIQLKRGSRAHVTLGCAEGYSALQTGFDQMELLLCEENGVTVGESVVMDDVELTYYGEGRCTVYFDWPIYKSALFTGKY